MIHVSLDGILPAHRNGLSSAGIDVVGLLVRSFLYMGCYALIDSSMTFKRQRRLSHYS
jgi:hypothetical protein